MIVKISDYIFSPLAAGTHENYEAVKAGRSALARHEGKLGLPAPFVASLFDGRIVSEFCRERGIRESLYTRFEQISIISAYGALEKSGIKAYDNELLFIIATTKGNIELLEQSKGNRFPSSRVLLTEAAKAITGWFWNPNPPLVVCNACISGLSAQLEAARILESGKYRYAAVIGADILSPFIIGGFESLKATSNRMCRPFDEERNGLNLGEAAACVIYGRMDEECDTSGVWHISGGALRNDASHISNPSKSAEGAYRALKNLLDNRDTSDIALINVHGTATIFNDEMEAVAIDRMGLNSTPAFGLKGYFGHTMGASGVLETLIAMEAVGDGIIPATKGFETAGTSRSINISNVNRVISGNSFIKMMSGFGGCNAALLFESGVSGRVCRHRTDKADYGITHTLHMTAYGVSLDGKRMETEGKGMELLKYLYNGYVKNYPKFHKMDPLCKLGFIASELLLDREAETEGVKRFIPTEGRAVIFVGKSASICADRTFQKTIDNADEFYPSPSAFVYTLPNMVTGEIAIRNCYYGETSYLAQEHDGNVMNFIEQALEADGTSSVLGGWIEMADKENFETKLYIAKKFDSNGRINP